VAQQLWSITVLALALAGTGLVFGLIFFRVALARWLSGLDQLQEFAAVLGSGTMDIAHLKLQHAPTEIVKIVDIFNKTATSVREREATRRELNNQKFALDQHAIVSIVDLAGHITYANDRLCAISGYSREELIGAHIGILNSGRHSPEFYKQVWGRLKTGQVWTGETCNRTRSGSLYWVVSTIVPLIGENGLPEQYIAIRTDISERKRVEIEKAELLERFKSLAAELETKTIALEHASRREVEIGNRIQQTLLVTPAAPCYPGLMVSSFSQSSKGIDGDFFDVFQTSSNIIDVVVGDVMGKGVPAALLGAATKLQFSRSMAELLAARGPTNGLPEPKDIVSSVNRAMAPHLQALDAFVTLAYLRIDVGLDTVTWVGCGHEEPLLLTANGGSRTLGNQHPPIGLFLNESYSQDVCSLMPDDAVFLCSDGASDAILKNGDRLGHALLNQTVSRHAQSHATPAMVIHALRRDLLVDTATLTDDLTMVMLSRYSLERNIARLEAPVALGSLRQMREFMEIHTAHLSESVAGPLVVAAVEVTTNVIRHAIDLVPNAPIEVVVETSPNGTQFDFNYLGARFDPPANRPDTDFSDFPEGGFGLYIIQAASDRVEHLHHLGVNTVRMWINPPD
jgi:PAS domain S-box-containing protein